MALFLQSPPTAGSGSLVPGAGLPHANNPLADLLRSPDDLLKLSAHRKKVLKEKAQIDARLNECVRTQLDETRDGLRKLQDARNAVGRLREEMIGIEQLKDADAATGNDGFEVYTKISKVGPLFCFLFITQKRCLPDLITSTRINCSRSPTFIRA